MGHTAWSMVPPLLRTFILPTCSVVRSPVWWAEGSEGAAPSVPGQWHEVERALTDGLSVGSTSLGPWRV